MQLTNGVVTIDLPDDLEWVDEFEHSPIEQDLQYTIGGNAVVQESAKVKGRPFTLVGGDQVWMTKSTVKQVYDMMVMLDQDVFLTMPDASVYKVIFRHAETPFSAFPVHRQTVTTDATMYNNITLKLMEIA